MTTFHYQPGDEPNITIPAHYDRTYRYLLGRLGTHPLVVVCMNPSTASETESDRTAQRIIEVSKRLGYDGWVIVNTYPVRATHPQDLPPYDAAVSAKNCATVVDFLQEHHIDEVWGAWGDLNEDALVQGKKDLLVSLKKHEVKVFYFAVATPEGALRPATTAAGNPYHPLARVKFDYSTRAKQYLSW